MVDSNEMLVRQTTQPKETKGCEFAAKQRNASEWRLETEDHEKP